MASASSALQDFGILRGSIKYVPAPKGSPSRMRVAEMISQSTDIAGKKSDAIFPWLTFGGRLVLHLSDNAPCKAETWRFLIMGSPTRRLTTTGHVNHGNDKA